MNSNRTFFSASPFGHGGYSRAMVQAPTLGRPRVLPLSPTRAISPYRAPTQYRGLGQLDELVDAVTGALGIVDGLIAQVPVHLAGNFETRRDACLDESIWSSKRYNCLIKLTRDIRDAIKGEGGTPSAPPSPTGTTKEPTSEFPWVPVAIGTVAVLAIGYAIATKGQ